MKRLAPHIGDGGRTCWSLSAAVFRRGERVAVKIVRNIPCFREVAKSEIAVLEEINGLDDESRL